MLDQLFALFLVVLFPLYNWNEARKVRRDIAGGLDPAKIDTAGDYRKGIAILWAIGIAGVALWLFQSRSWDALGMGAGTDSALRWAGGIAVAVAGLVLTHLQAAQLGRSEDARKQLLDQLGDLLFFLPKTKREFYLFKWLSLAAGVCEEILYRGFLIWFIASYLGILPAILLSSLAFGVAHSYQGFSNAVQTAIIGLWMAILFWLTGSVWIPMVTHFLVDVIGGRMIYGVLSQDTRGPGGEQVAAPGEA
ncbi:MAG: CPBP family intramembrane metalloprotease [Gemmatimonadetes bacterium]|nr:CPBP family intramembrane metalloprotease [Gemmatimonadota bacterium]